LEDNLKEDAMIDGSKIRNRRKALEMTLHELASMAEISESYLSKIENNSNINTTTPILDRIEDALQLSERINSNSDSKYNFVPGVHSETLDTLLEDLTRLLRSYNRKGEITLNETIEILSRVDKIIKFKI
jgi:transcriptional regulator with XRE-family HTH domain